jgi:hypothetical protein
MIDGKNAHIICFDDEEEAVRRYSKAAAPFGRLYGFSGG